MQKPDDDGPEDRANDSASARDPAPVTPHAAPSIDAQGTLSYVGDDGRRYVVAPPPA